MIEISFVIPAYNVELYVERCLNSIYSQGVDDSLFEVIAIDDGSTDKTLAILKEYQAGHSNMEVLTQENQGPSVARNKGIDLSRGKYIWFVDSDDYIGEAALPYLLSIVKKDSLDALFFSVKVINVDGSSYTQVIPKELTNKPMTGIQIIRNGFDIGSVCMGVWKSIYLKENNFYFLPDVDRGEDSLFVFSAVLLAGKVLVDDTPLYVYERKVGTLTTGKTIEIYIKQKKGEVKIISTLRALSNDYKEIDRDVCYLAGERYKKNLIGLICSIIRGKLHYQEKNKEIVEAMKKENLFPVVERFGSFKKELIRMLFNFLYKS